MDRIAQRFGLDTKNIPDEVLQTLEKGLQMMEGQLYERALLEFSRAVAQEPDFSVKLLQKLFIELDDTQHSEAFVTVGTNLFNQNPENLELANLLGNAYRRQGDLTQARTIYRKILNQNPQHSWAALNLAATQAGTELYDSQIPPVLESMQTDHAYCLPQDEDGFNRLLKAYYQVYPMPEMESALGLQGETLDSLPEDPEITGPAPIDDVFDFLKDTEKHASASPQPEAPATSNDDWEDLAEQDTTGINLPAPDSLLEALSRLHSTGDVSSTLWTSLGWYALEQDCGEVARTAFGHLGGTLSSDFTVRLWSALAEDACGKSEDALSALQQLARQHPSHRLLLHNLGLLCHRQQKFQAGNQFLLRTHRLLQASSGHYNPQVCLDEAEELLTQGRYKDALQIYEPLLAEIQEPTTQLQIAKAYKAQGLLNQAYPLLLTALRNQRQSREIRAMLRDIWEEFRKQAEIALKRGDQQKAVELLETCIEITPTQPLVRKAIELQIQLNNRKRAQVLRKRLKDLIEIDRNRKIEQWVREAEEALTENDFFKAYRCYTEALCIDPRHEIHQKIQQLCHESQRPDVASRVLVWYERLTLRNRREEISLPL